MPATFSRASLHRPSSWGKKAGFCSTTTPLSDALAFGRRVAAEKLLLFHHDPMHSDDFLDSFSGDVAARWQDLGGEPARVELATERRELSITQRRPTASAAG